MSAKPLLLQAIEGAESAYEKMKDDLPKDLSKESFLLMAVTLGASLSLLDSILKNLYGVTPDRKTDGA